MEYNSAIFIEDPLVEFVDFLGYLIPQRFSVLFWIAIEDYEDLFTVNLKYEIAAQGTPKVTEVRVSGTHPDNFPNHYEGNVLRNQLSWVDKNYRALLIGGLQVATQYKYRLEKWENGHVAIGKSRKKIDLADLKDFELELREKLGKTQKLTPEFLKEILDQRSKYKTIHGSHRGFNQKLAEQEGVKVKTVEAWVAKAESHPVKETGNELKKKKGK